MTTGNIEAARSDYAQDGSVDLKGNPILRSKRGGWRACAFVVGKKKLCYSFFSELVFFVFFSKLRLSHLSFYGNENILFVHLCVSKTRRFAITVPFVVFLFSMKYMVSRKQVFITFFSL